MTKQNKLPRVFTCTRPSLAAELMQAGYEARQTVNPWDPNLRAWVFEIDAVGVDIIKTHYARAGKKPPRSIEQMAKGAAV